MVDISQIPTANQLINELATIAGAIANIDATPTPGSITSFVIGAPPPPPGGGPSDLMPRQVDSRYMTAPPPMYAAIKEFLMQRQTDINAQLASMGITVGPGHERAAKP
jgi:hypothetical protein